jgi:hypothetical protein
LQIPALQCGPVGGEMAATGGSSDEVVTQDRATKAKRDKVHKVADDIVTPNSLATHLGMSRQ